MSTPSHTMQIRNVPPIEGGWAVEGKCSTCNYRYTVSVPDGSPGSAAAGRAVVIAKHEAMLEIINE